MKKVFQKKYEISFKNQKHLVDLYYKIKNELEEKDLEINFNDRDLKISLGSNYEDFLKLISPNIGNQLPSLFDNVFINSRADGKYLSFETPNKTIVVASQTGELSNVLLSSKEDRVIAYDKHHPFFEKHAEQNQKENFGKKKLFSEKNIPSYLSRETVISYFANQAEKFGKPLRLIIGESHARSFVDYHDLTQNDSRNIAEKEDHSFHNEDFILKAIQSGDIPKGATIALEGLSYETTQKALDQWLTDGDMDSPLPPELTLWKPRYGGIFSAAKEEGIRILAIDTQAVRFTGKAGEEWYYERVRDMNYIASKIIAHEVPETSPLVVFVGGAHAVSTATHVSSEQPTFTVGLDSLIPNTKTILITRTNDLPEGCSTEKTLIHGDKTLDANIIINVPRTLNERSLSRLETVDERSERIRKFNLKTQDITLKMPYEKGKQNDNQQPHESPGDTLHKSYGSTGFNVGMSLLGGMGAYNAFQKGQTLDGVLGTGQTITGIVGMGAEAAVQNKTLITMAPKFASGAGTAAKAIPFIGAIFCAYSAIQDSKSIALSLKNKDFIGVIKGGINLVLDAAMGITAFIPGLGTAVSVAIAAARIFSDGLVDQTSDIYTYQRNFLAMKDPQASLYEKVMAGLSGATEYIWEKAILKYVAPKRTQETAEKQAQFIETLKNVKNHIHQFYTCEHDTTNKITTLDFLSGPLSQYAGHLNVTITSSKTAKMSLKTYEGSSQEATITFGQQSPNVLLVKMGQGITYSYEWELLDQDTDKKIAKTTTLDPKSLTATYYGPTDGTDVIFKAAPYAPQVGESFLPPITNSNLIQPQNFHYTIHGGTGANTYILGQQKTTIYCRGSKKNEIHIPFYSDSKRTLDLYNLLEDGTCEIYLLGVPDNSDLLKKATFSFVSQENKHTLAVLNFGQTSITLHSPNLKKVFIKTEESDFVLNVEKFIASHKQSDNISQYFMTSIIGAELNFSDSDNRLNVLDVFNTKNKKEINSFVEDIKNNPGKYIRPHGSDWKDPPAKIKKHWFLPASIAYDTDKYQTDVENWIIDYCSFDVLTGTPQADIFAINANFGGKVIIKNFEINKDILKVRNLDIPENIPVSIVTNSKLSTMEVHLTLGKKNLVFSYSGQKISEIPNGTLKINTGLGAIHITLTQNKGKIETSQTFIGRTEKCIVGKKNTIIINSYDTGTLTIKDFDPTRDLLKMSGFSNENLEDMIIYSHETSSLCLESDKITIEISLLKMGSLVIQTNNGIFALTTRNINEEGNALKDYITASTLWPKNEGDTLTCTLGQDFLTWDTKAYQKMSVKNFNSNQDTLKILNVGKNWFEKIKANVNKTSQILSLTHDKGTVEICWTTMETLKIQTNNGEFTFNGANVAKNSGPIRFADYLTSAFIKPQGHVAKETLHGTPSPNTFIIDSQSVSEIIIKDWNSSKDKLSLLNVSNSWFEKATLKKKNAEILILSVDGSTVEIHSKNFVTLTIKTEGSLFTIAADAFLKKTQDGGHSLLKEYIPFAYMEDRSLMDADALVASQKIATPGHNIFMVNGAYQGSTTIQKFDTATDQVQITNATYAEILATEIKFDKAASMLTLSYQGASFQLKLYNTPQTLFVGTVDILFEISLAKLITSEESVKLGEHILYTTQGLEDLSKKIIKDSYAFSGTQGMDAFLVNTEQHNKVAITNFHSQKDKIVASFLDYAWFKNNSALSASYTNDSSTLEMKLGESTIKLSASEKMGTLILDSDEGAFSFNAEKILSDKAQNIQKPLKDYIISTLMKPKAFNDTYSVHAETYEGTPGKDELLINAQRKGTTTVTCFDFKTDQVQIVNAANNWFKDPTSKISCTQSGNIYSLKISLGQTHLILSTEKLGSTLDLKVNDGTYSIAIDGLLDPNASTHIDDYISASTVGFKNIMYTKESLYHTHDIFVSSLGRDTFIISPKHAGKTVIRGFDPMKDRISLTEQLSFETLYAKAAQKDDQVTITFDEENSLTIENFTIAQLTADLLW
jgi:hypothetical protein